MKKGLTELVFVLDRSGSMHGLEKDTVGGFNSMVEMQRNGEGGVVVSTVLFNHETKVLHDRAAIEAVKPLKSLDYVPMGSTALLDAVGGAIRHIGKVHRYIRKEDRPEHTLFVIITDGMENASRKYTHKQVRSMITEKKEQGWEFLFLGANIDVGAAAEEFGIGKDRAVEFLCDEEGTRLNYDVVGQAVTHVRMCGGIPMGWDAPIVQDRKKRSRVK